MLFQISVILCVISLNNIVSVSADIKGDPKLSANAELLASRPEAGFLDKLNYLWLNIKCGVKLLGEWNSCKNEANEYWKDLPYSDRVKCCSSFDITFCLIKKAKEMCDPEVAKDIITKAKEAMDKSTEDECEAYGHRWYDWKTFKCHIPWVAIAILIVVIVGVIIVAIVLFQLFK